MQNPFPPEAVLHNGQHSSQGAQPSVLMLCVLEACEVLLEEGELLVIAIEALKRIPSLPGFVTAAQGRAAAGSAPVPLCRDGTEQEQDPPWPQSCCRHSTGNLGIFPTREFLQQISCSSLQSLELHLSLSFGSFGPFWENPEFFS